MVTLLGLLLPWLGTPVVTSAKAIEPAGQSDASRVVTFQDQVVGWTCRLEALDEATFLDRLRGEGVPESLLNRPAWRRQLQDMLFFEVDWMNETTADLTFNVDQVLLRSGHGPAGTMLDVAHLWPGSSPSGQPSYGQEYVDPNHPDAIAWKNLASLFTRGTVTIPAGSHGARLLAFNPTGRRFPRRVQLVLDRIYHGAEPFRLEAQFKVRYR